jgi:hypothetical protein
VSLGRFNKPPAAHNRFFIGYRNKKIKWTVVEWLFKSVTAIYNRVVMLPQQLHKYQNDLIQIAKDNDVSYLACFGSYARGEQKKIVT